MKVIGLRIKKELLGESCIPLEQVIPVKKAIATTRAFGKKTSELKYIEEAVSTYAVRCAEKLRKQKSVANILTVFIHTDPFNPGDIQYNKSKTIPLPVATNSNSELVKYSLFCLTELFRRDYKFKKAGVIVEELQSEQAFQADIFDKENRSFKINSYQQWIISMVNLAVTKLNWPFREAEKNGSSGRKNFRKDIQPTGTK